SVCPLWPADIPPALCRKARPSAATYTTSRDTIVIPRIPLQKTDRDQSARFAFALNRKFFPTKIGHLAGIRALR
ncbi:hypothetical protein, partial [Sinorhizobium meliloti]